MPKINSKGKQYLRVCTEKVPGKDMEKKDGMRVESKRGRKGGSEGERKRERKKERERLRERRKSKREEREGD